MKHGIFVFVIFCSEKKFTISISEIDWIISMNIMWFLVSFYFYSFSFFFFHLIFSFWYVHISLTQKEIETLFFSTKNSLSFCEKKLSPWKCIDQKYFLFILDFQKKKLIEKKSCGTNDIKIEIKIMYLQIWKIIILVYLCWC